MNSESKGVASCHLGGASALRETWGFQSRNDEMEALRLTVLSDAPLVYVVHTSSNLVRPRRVHTSCHAHDAWCINFRARDERRVSHKELPLGGMLKSCAILDPLG